MTKWQYTFSCVAGVAIALSLFGCGKQESDKASSTKDGKTPSAAQSQTATQTQPTVTSSEPSRSMAPPTPSPDDRSSTTDSRVELAWENIQDQMRTYKVLESLTGQERRLAANKLVFGYQRLRQDVDFFLENARRSDPRRPAVEQLQRIMEKSRNR